MIDIGKAIVKKIPPQFGGGVAGRISSWLDFVNDGLQDPKHRDVLEKIRKLTVQLEQMNERLKKLHPEKETSI
jgi:hypothetical protein